MQVTTVARSYAEALLELAQRDGALEAYAAAIHELADWMRREPRFQRFLETPRVRVAEKKEALRRAFQGKMPDRFLRFLYVVLDKGRQRLLPEIAQEFARLLNEHLGRVPVEITLAQPADDGLRSRIEGAVEEWVGRPVVPQYRIDPEILGGLVLRVEDRVLDASLRRRLLGLRRAMLLRNGAGAAAGGATNPTATG